MSIKLTQAEFIMRSITKHGNTIDYSKVDYKNAKTPVQLVCKFHGLFKQIPWRHLQNKTGCRKCGRQLQINKRRKTISTFIQQALSIHKDKYNYQDVNYINSFTKIKIICKLHGEFWQTPANHLSGNGCPSCRNRYTTAEFIQQSKKIHNNYYDYSLTTYEHSLKLVKIICPKHGVFEQCARNHLSGKGCYKCCLSKGELKIKAWLLEQKIPFETQKTFNTCLNPKTGFNLYYDFYLPTYNTIIEFHGKQHYEMFRNWLNETKQRFLSRQYRDKIKEQFLVEHSIKFIKIKYTIKNISNFLQKQLSQPTKISPTI